MKISVAIPTYNSSKVISVTLESVFKQSLAPAEILVLDDGSTDDTVAILKSYAPRVTVLQQVNQGVAPARNALARRATGDAIAYLDHDDLWHPDYLKTQKESLERHENAVAAFTAHVDFEGYGQYDWAANKPDAPSQDELIQPLDFLKRYNSASGVFGSMSFCCVLKKTLDAIGAEPFQVSGVDDSYLCTLFPLFGPVVFLARARVAYRITREAQSVNRVKVMGLWLKMFELLEERYSKIRDARLRAAFKVELSGAHRAYADVLMGAGRIAEARVHFWRAMAKPGNFNAFAKSLGLLGLSWMPTSLQPKWRPSQRPGLNQI